MKKRIADFIQVLSSPSEANRAKKLSFSSFSSAFIHWVFTIAFAKNQLSFLATYNLIVFLIYLFFGFYVGKRRKYQTMYYFAMIEVPSHSTMASLMVGWDCGFMLYIISMIPVTFYFMMSIKELKKNILQPLFFSLLFSVYFIVTRHLCIEFTAPYGYMVSESLARTLYDFNSFVAFSISLTFSIFFTLEVFYTEKQLIKENTKLDLMASLDPLTKLLNRRSMENHLNEVMEHARESGTPFSLVMGDIDDFKKVNDTYGHDYGDKVLVGISKTITDQLRSEDYLCRWGGEEFLILIHANQEVAVKIMERVRIAISETEIPNENTGKAHCVTMTFGVATYAPDCSIKDIIHTADKNLYAGKKAGKNKVVAEE